MKNGIIATGAVVAVAVTLLIFCFNGYVASSVPAAETEGQPDEYVVTERGSQYEILYNACQDKYAYKIFFLYDNVVSEEGLSACSICFISENIMKVCTGEGVFRYFEMPDGYSPGSKKVVNPWFEFPDNGFWYVIHYENDTFVVRHLFNASPFSFRFPAVFPSDISGLYPKEAVLSEDKTRLTIRYLESDGVTETTRVLTVQEQSDRVSTYHLDYFDKRDDSFSYFSVDIPVVKGIGTPARTARINAEYYDNDVRSGIQVAMTPPPATAAGKNRVYIRWYEVLAETDTYISIYVDEYLLAGGAHGSEMMRIDTWDIDTGRRLTIEDFVGDIPEWRTRIEDKMLAENKRTLRAPTLEGRDRMFCVKDGYLHIYYDVYELGSHVDGRFEYTINIEELR